MKRSLLYRQAGVRAWRLSYRVIVECRAEFMVRSHWTLIMFVRAPKIARLIGENYFTVTLRRRLTREQARRLLTGGRR